jgi:transposase InsO family protein
VSRFQFVADHRHAFEVKRLCELVEVRRSSFYAWLAGAPARAAKAEDDRLLAERIRAIHDADNTLGVPRVTPELNDGAGADERVNHKRVARVMREHGIRGYTKRRRVRTTIPQQSDAKVPDLVKRDFTAPAPNMRYVGDITYLPIADGSNLYLATVIDCFSRRLVGWSVADHMRTELVQDALKAAAATRGSLAGAIFHSDHGSVYTSQDHAKLCKDLGSSSPWGPSARVPITPWPRRSTRPRNARSSRTHPPGPTRRRAAARSSAGSCATTPDAGTPGAATPHRPSTRRPTPPAKPLL